LREGLLARVEHQIARRDDWYPIQDRLRQIGPRVVVGNRHAAVVLTVRDERPPIVLALLDQVQLVATAWAVLDLPELAGRRKRQTIGGTNAGGPGLRGRLIA